MNNFDKQSFKYHDFTQRNSFRFSFGRMLFSIMLIFAMIMLFVSLVRKANSGIDISFNSFLNWLGSVKTFQFNVNINDFFILGDWGIFEFVRNFLNFFSSFLGVIVFLSSNVLNLLIYIIQFVGFLYA